MPTDSRIELVILIYQLQGTLNRRLIQNQQYSSVSHPSQQPKAISSASRPENSSTFKCVCVSKSSLLTSFLSSIIPKLPSLLIRTKYSKIHRRLLTLFFQSSIIALIEIFRKENTMFTKLKQTFIGRPLKSLTEGEGGLLGKMQALAMLSNDALSSIAYGPEQVVLVLTSLSPLAIWWSLPIGLFVLPTSGQPDRFLPSNHPCLSSRRRGLYGNSRKSISRARLDRWR